MYARVSRCTALLLCTLLVSCQGLDGLQVQGIDLGRLNQIGEKLTNLGEKSADEEQVIGANAAAILMQQAPLLNNPGIQRYVNQVGLWVALQSERPDLPWQFAVLDTPQVGAYAAPGGYVFITTGMLNQLSSEADLAGVLAHEVAHVVQRHHLKAIQQQSQTGLLSDLAVLAAQTSQARSGDIDGRGAYAADRFTKSVSDLYARGLSRDDEYQADAMGVILASRAGYDPYGLASVLQGMSSARQDAPTMLTFLKLHPNLGERLNRLEPIYQKLPSGVAQGPQLEERYLKTTGLRAQ